MMFCPFSESVNRSHRIRTRKCWAKNSPLNSCWFSPFFGSPVECCVCSTVVCWEMNNRNCSNKFSDISFFFLWKCSRLWPSSIKTGRRAIGHLTPGVPPSTSRTGRCDYANYHDEYHLLIYKNITYFISSASVCENNEHVFFLRFFFLFYDFLHRFYFGGPAGTKFIRCRIYDRNLTILPMKLSSFCGHSVSPKLLFFVNSSRVNGIYGLKITRMKSRRPVWGLIHRLLSTVHQTYHVSKVSHVFLKKLYANRWCRPECISMFWVNIRGPQSWLWSNSFTTWPLQRN